MDEKNGKRKSIMEKNEKMGKRNKDKSKVQFDPHRPIKE